ncbi:MAG: trehalose-6-phosphate synthase, partial [Nocardiopsaceae bacterium]|nr:trehalose-6-phosphate synthase [Nocardiopsaceae bacterium]
MNSDPGRMVLVASNRGPVSFSIAADGTPSAKRGGGGMVSGLTSGLAAIAPEGGVSWVCAALSDADREAVRKGARGDGGPGDVPVRMLDIPPATFDAAYNRVANSVLWFVNHLLFDTPVQPRFDAGFRRDWACYEAYNEAFARALADEAGDGTRVLVQDYHLALVPRLLRERLLRERRPGARIAHFQHTPWAPPEYFRMLPDEVAAGLLEGMLGADHAGFLAGRWAGAFLDCCEAVLGAKVSRVADDAGPAAAGQVAGQ